MKKEFILDLESFHIMETVIDLSGLTDDQFINLCIHHYGETLKHALVFIATNGPLPDVEVDNDSKFD